MTCGIQLPTGCVLADLPEPGSDNYEPRLWEAVLQTLESIGRPYTADDVQELGEFLANVSRIACSGVPA